MKAKASSARSSKCNDDDYGSHVPTTPPASPDLRSHGIHISVGGDLQATTNYPQEHSPGEILHGYLHLCDSLEEEMVGEAHQPNLIAAERGRGFPISHFHLRLHFLLPTSD